MRTDTGTGIDMLHRDETWHSIHMSQTNELCPFSCTCMARLKVDAPEKLHVDALHRTRVFQSAIAMTHISVFYNERSHDGLLPVLYSALRAEYNNLDRKMKLRTSRRAAPSCRLLTIRSVFFLFFIFFMNDSLLVLTHASSAPKACRKRKFVHVVQL